LIMSHRGNREQAPSEPSDWMAPILDQIEDETVRSAFGDVLVRIDELARSGQAEQLTGLLDSVSWLVHDGPTQVVDAVRDWAESDQAEDRHLAASIVLIGYRADPVAMSKRWLALLNDADDLVRFAAAASLAFAGADPDRYQVPPSVSPR
jgi:hypothetical protein